MFCVSRCLHVFWVDLQTSEQTSAFRDFHPIVTCCLSVYLLAFQREEGEEEGAQQGAEGPLHVQEEEPQGGGPDKEQGPAEEGTGPPK